MPMLMDFSSKNPPENAKTVHLHYVSVIQVKILIGFTLRSLNSYSKTIKTVCKKI